MGRRILTRLLVSALSLALPAHFSTDAHASMSPRSVTDPAAPIARLSAGALSETQFQLIIDGTRHGLTVLSAKRLSAPYVDIKDTNDWNAVPRLELRDATNAIVATVPLPELLRFNLDSDVAIAVSDDVIRPPTVSLAVKVPAVSFDDALVVIPGAASGAGPGGQDRTISFSPGLSSAGLELLTGPASGSLNSNASLMAPAPPAGVEVRTLINHGPPAFRFDLVILADLYDEAEKETFFSTAQDYLQYLFTKSPFSDYSMAFNVYAVFRPVAQSGQYPGNYKTSPLVVNPTPLFLDAALAPGFEGFPILLCNDPYYGGGGQGVIAWSNTGWLWSGTNDPQTPKKVMVHEFGHGFGNFIGDEYRQSVCPPSIEPEEINVTTVPGCPKWSPWIVAGRAGCIDSADCVGWYRSAASCMMRNYWGEDPQFCPVCREGMLLLIRRRLPVLGATSFEFTGEEALIATEALAPTSDTRVYVNSLEVASSCCAAQNSTFRVQVPEGTSHVKIEVVDLSGDVIRDPTGLMRSTLEWTVTKHDEDGDGVLNSQDLCPCDPTEWDPNMLGDGTTNTSDEDGLCDSCDASLSAYCAAVCRNAALDLCPNRKDLGRNCNLHAEQALSAPKFDDVCDPVPCEAAKPSFEYTCGAPEIDSQGHWFKMCSVDFTRLDYTKVSKTTDSATFVGYRACFDTWLRKDPRYSSKNCLDNDLVSDTLLLKPAASAADEVPGVPWRRITIPGVTQNNIDADDRPPSEACDFSKADPFSRNWLQVYDFTIRWGYPPEKSLIWTHVDTTIGMTVEVPGYGAHSPGRDLANSYVEVPAPYEKKLLLPPAPGPWQLDHHVLVMPECLTCPFEGFSRGDDHVFGESSILVGFDSMEAGWLSPAGGLDSTAVLSAGLRAALHAYAWTGSSDPVANAGVAQSMPLAVAYSLSGKPAILDLLWADSGSLLNDADVREGEEHTALAGANAVLGFGALPAYYSDAADRTNPIVVYSRSRGMVLFVGGDSDGSPTKEIVKYDFRTHNWTTIVPEGVALSQVTAAQINDRDGALWVIDSGDGESPRLIRVDIATAVAAVVAGGSGGMYSRVSASDSASDSASASVSNPASASVGDPAVAGVSGYESGLTLARYMSFDRHGGLLIACASVTGNAVFRLAGAGADIQVTATWPLDYQPIMQVIADPDGARAVVIADERGAPQILSLGAPSSPAGAMADVLKTCLQ